MTCPTTLIPAPLARDLTTTLARLRKARADEDPAAELVAENRLNYLLDNLPRIVTGLKTPPRNR